MFVMRTSQLVTLVSLLTLGCHTSPLGLAPSTEAPLDGATESLPDAGLEPAGPEGRAMDALPPVASKPRARAEAAPISLVTPDGIALELRRLHAETVVEGPLAHTELRLAFRNPQPRTVEGRFRIALPARSSIARLAMNVNGTWQEGEVLPRKVATLAYEESLHRKVDPALLEQGAGNTFAARVFPIGAGEEKQLVIGYSQVLTDATQVVVPLRGLGPIADARAVVWRSGVARETLLTGAPQDLAAGALATEPAAEAVRSGDVVAMRVRPVAAQTSEPLSSLVVLVDTSASRALDLATELELVRDLAAALAQRRGARLAVVAFDQTQEVVFDGTARDFGAGHLERIARRGALGASDLGAALAVTGRLAKASGYTRALVIGDGVVTAGARADDLVASVRALGEAGLERLDAFALGGIRDEATLRALVTAGLARSGVVADAARGLSSIWARLEETIREEVTLDVDGASWVYPRKARGVAAGEELVVFARVPEGRALELRVDGQRVTAPEPKPGSPELLERAAASAQLDDWLDVERRQGSTPDLRGKIEELSVRARVISPYTALLVLESEADYQRLGLARGSLAPIVTVAKGQLAQAHRQPPASGSGSPPVALSPSRAQGDAADDTGNAWGADLGLSGIGAGGGGSGARFGVGFGSGHGRLGGSHRGKPSVAVRLETPSASEGLPAPVVHRLLRQQFGRFRLAYEQELRREPSFAATLTLAFTVAPSGAVESVSVTGPGPTTLHTAVGRAIWSMSFPRTEGEAANVRVALRLGAGGARGEATTTSVPRPPNAAPSPPAEEAVPPAAPSAASPYQGRLDEVMALLANDQLTDAVSLATTWHADEPGDALAALGLGEALERSGRSELAARAYGSLLDLFPERVDVARYAASRLAHLKHRGASALSLDALARARKERADHPTSHRLYAYAVLAERRHAEAFSALRAGYVRDYPDGRFRGVKEVLAADLRLVGSAWLAATPSDSPRILRELEELDLAPDREPSRRFVLSWESDANDLDLHVYDDRGGHSWFSSPSLPSGGHLLADVTTGFGPEMFVVTGAGALTQSYRLAAHYYSHGPMGFGMGRVQVIDHDGKGHLTFEERPFVVMREQGLVPLGDVAARR